MVTIIPFTPEWSAAVQAFNSRLIVGGLDESLQFPATPEPEFATGPEGPLRQEYFLAVDGDVVRGGYFLTLERWLIRGQLHPVANYRLPLSEGLIAAEYRGVSLALMRHALKQQPLIYCLGMGSWDRPLPRSLQAMKWPMFETPFFFRAVRPSRVLRNLVSVRRSPARRIAFDIAAWTGAGWAGIHLLQRRRMTHGGPERLRSSPVQSASDWPDAVWDRVKDAYPGLSQRTSDVLQVRYPAQDSRFIRLRMDDAQGPGAYAILLDTPMRGHHHFGDLRVGTIVDCFAAPEHAREVVRKATRVLEERGVDLIVSNQSHCSWCEAFRQSGFLEGPSNRIFAASPKLAALLEPFDETRHELHLTRGDAAGPIHL